MEKKLVLMKIAILNKKIILKFKSKKSASLIISNSFQFIFESKNAAT